MLHLTRNPKRYFRCLCSVRKLVESSTVRSSYYATSIDATDSLTVDLILRQRFTKLYPIGIRYFMKTDSESNTDFAEMTIEKIESIILQLMSKNKDRRIQKIMINLTDNRVLISENLLKKLLRFYSTSGKPEYVEVLQNYCYRVYPILHKRNGGFEHYLAKAQCLKGNSEKGLKLLSSCYEKNESFRSLYRVLFKELIQDSVMNRSEASMVIFKKYVIMFSKERKDHYPLVCLWHLCWSSSWFSDQVSAEELLDESKDLQEIVRDRATTFAINKLKEDYNEDAVLRLLQSLLKYKLMTEYAKVLQILFNYKYACMWHKLVHKSKVAFDKDFVSGLAVRNRDIRGCTEILKNCETLGVTLPSDQQGRYIRMLIDGKKPIKQTTKHELQDFKLKF